MDLVTSYISKKEADILASDSDVHSFVKGFDATYGGFDCAVAGFDYGGLSYAETTALDFAGYNRATTRYREGVVNYHKTRAFWYRDWFFLLLN